MKLTEKIVNSETGEETLIEREATAEDLAGIAEAAEKTRLAAEQRAEAEAKKAAALAKLAALGLTEDDLKAII